METEFGKQWSLKWTEGCIIGYVRGTLESKRAVGMLKRALKLGVKETELKTILDNIKNNPIYLPSMRSEEKARKINELKKTLELK